MKDSLPSTEKDKGFTIIEVVLVLAIAGLIFLVVFLALPALQRNQRDAQRRSDMARLMTIIETFKTNNMGRAFCEQSFTSASGYIQPTFAGRTPRSQVMNYCGSAERAILEADATFSVTPSDHPTVPATTFGYADPLKGNPFLVATGSGGIGYENNYRPALHMGAKCGASAESNYFTAVNSAKKYALSTRLESGGYVCVDNS